VVDFAVILIIAAATATARVSVIIDMSAFEYFRLVSAA
jgi:hypothetical protein